MLKRKPKMVGIFDALGEQPASRRAFFARCCPEPSAEAKNTREIGWLLLPLAFELQFRQIYQLFQ
jgi:hypothetical protein